MDPTDQLLSIGAAFDILSPILNWLQGYNTLYAGGLDYEEAILTQMSLQGQGIRARVEGVGSYRVVVKE